MTETYLEVGDDVERALAEAAHGARLRLAPGRHIVAAPIVRNESVTLVGEPGRSIVTGEHQSGLIVLSGSLQTFAFEGVVFEAGAATCGGAIEVVGPSKVQVEHCSFRRNRAREAGGALFVQDAEARIVRCSFEDNVAGRGGGAVVVDQGAHVRLDRCVFSTNLGMAGGAILLSGTGALELRNATFVGNRCRLERGGSAFFVAGAQSSGPSAFVANCIFAGHGAIASDPSTRYAVYFKHSVVPDNLFGQPGFEDVGGNTVGEPKLVTVTGGGWRLAPGAPGTRTADVSRIEPGALDIGGAPLVQNGTADPGAFAAR